jgi:hypothetical protein
MEYMFARLCDGKLTGKPIADWSDDDLRRFADRYNLGWIVCWSSESIARFRQCKFATELAQIRDGDAGVFFKLNRKLSYVLKGQATWVQADWERLALADVIPENGEVLLSLHYQSNWRVAPVYVQVEEYLDPDDPRPLVRIRLPGQVHRLTFVWENP